MKKLFILILLSLSFTSHAKLLQIIHTNDLHSYFEGHVDGKGGYARLKAKLDDLKSQAESQGIATLILDAGDFGEGTSYFLADSGANSVRALGILGTEASVVGNHDYMMGGFVLAQQIRRANVATNILSANLVQTPDMDMGDLVKPFADFTKDGIKIRVIGLSTAEPQYQYALAPGYILEPAIIGNIEAKKAKSAGKDLVIALTHIGSYYDKLLVKSSSDIDLVVGGHDHLRLDQAMLIQNKNKKIVPIVQASSHGLVIGSLLIDVKAGGVVEVKEYTLHDIAPPMQENQQMRDLINHTHEQRNEMFNGRFDEVIGSTEIKLSGYENGHPVIRNTCWGRHMAKISTEATGADLGAHLAFFEGETIEPGPVTFGNIIDNFPHIKRLGDPGWEISSFETDGKTLKILLRSIIAIKKQFGFSFYGVDYKSIQMPEKFPYIGGYTYAFHFKIHGKSIENKSKYRMAFPREIADAVKVLLPKKAQDIFPKLENSGKFFWPLMEEHIKKNSPIKCL